MTELEFVKGETRESALAKAAAWYDDYQRKAVTTMLRAIEDAAVPKQQRSDALEFACQVAVEGRAPFLAQVARVLDKVIAMGRSQ